MSSVYIVEAKRSAIGKFMGVLQPLSAPQIAGAVLGEVCSALPDKAQIEQVLMGCVLSAGLGQAPARQAALLAGLPQSTGAITINKVCGSGLQTAMLASAQIALGQASLLAVGGMESMSNAPYLLPKLRQGQRMGHTQAMDHMFLDGLEDAYERGTAMGCYAEATAKRYDFSRKAQDDYACESLARAKSADFSAEICAVSVPQRAGSVDVVQDECPTSMKVEKISQLKPAFHKEGTVTAANASAIADGAAALLLASEEAVKEYGLKPRAKIISSASHAQEPCWFTLAPVMATQKLLSQAGWSAQAVDLYEINEAFAVVPMAWMRELNVSHERVNVKGGACALGHPIGASGARILVTLLHALEERDLSRGVASLCIGGGEAVAMAIERV